jgi:hypothetical protein
LKEGKSPILPGEGREDKGLGSFGRSFLYNLELGGGERINHHLDPLTCGLWREALESRGKIVPDYPQPSLPHSSIFHCTFGSPPSATFGEHTEGCMYIAARADGSACL